MKIDIGEKSYSPEELYVLAKAEIKRTDLKSWERALFEFINEWFGDSKTFSAHTSGSTGSPKKIILYKKHAIASAERTASYFNFQVGQHALLCLPPSFIAGKMMLVRALNSRLNLTIHEPSSTPLKTIDKPVDFIAMTPHQFSESLRTYPKKVSLLKKVLLGGAPVSTALQHKIKMLSTEVYLGYGMTETITHVAMRRLNKKSMDANSDERFTAMDGVSFTINENGCLIISAEHLGIDSLLTNDVVELIDEKSFQWLGRYDRIINSGGVKINPETFETELAKIISEPFFLYGIKDEVLGEKLILCIETSSHNYSLDTLKEVCPLLKEIHSVASFQRTHTSKIDRRKTVENVLRLGY